MVIILSMHRSGSSLLAGMLSDCGLNSGGKDQLIAASKDNEKGYIEHKGVVEINEKILSKKGYSSSFPDYSKPLTALKKETNSILKIVKDIEKNSIELIKDPRMCLTLPLWSCHFKNIKIIFLTRNPVQVAKSLNKRQKYPLTAGLALWEFYNYKALENSKHLDVKHIHFDELTSNPSITLKNLFVWLNKEPANYDFSFLDHKLIHQKKSDDLKELTESQLTLYNALSSKQQYNGPYSSRSMQLTMSLMNELTEMGYSPDSGRMKDPVTRKNEERLAQEKNEQKIFLSQKVDYWHSLSDDRLQTINSQKTRIQSQATSIEKNLKIIHTQTNKLKQQTSRINQLVERSQQWRAIKTILKAKTPKLFSLLKITNRKLFLPASNTFKFRIIPTAKKARRVLNANGIQYTVIYCIKRLKSELLSPKKGINVKEKQQQAESNASILKKHLPDLPESSLKILAAMLIPEYYANKSGIKESNPNKVTIIEHFATVGLKAGISPSPMFDEDFYIKKLSSLNEEITGKPALLHWLEFGVENKIIPTVLFDDEYFSELYKNSINKGEWPFQRFITTSVYNNTSPHKYFEPKWYVQHHNIKENDLPPFYHYLLIGSKLGWRPSALFPCFSRQQCIDMDISPLEFVLKQTAMHEIQNRLKNGKEFSNILKKVAEYAPEIHLPPGHKRINIPPYNTPVFPAIKNIRTDLQKKSYDSIVLIPHCRYGGSGLVAGEVCNTLKKYSNDESVLLIRTDHDDFMRPDWFPENIDIINLIDYCPDLPDVFRKKVLLDTLIGLKPKRIFNIHSRLGWIVFEEYGDRLSLWSSLYGYTFCYDVDFMGKKVGYPIKFVPNCMQSMKSLFIDNQFLKDDLIQTNSWDKETANKAIVLKTPPKEKPTFVWTAPNKSENQKKCIFWAGRFDKQKRFDLVVKIAKLCPEYEFWVWGKAMLGEDLNENSLPSNITLKGLFQDFNEIPFENCDAWLYTSQWDGIPTILIELGMRGIPIVSSKVWGTAELITNKTAWPVEKTNNVNEYKKGLDHFINNPDDAKKRGETLKELVHSEHNSEKFIDSISKIICDDKWVSAS